MIFFKKESTLWKEESKHGSPCFPALQIQDELSKAACTGKQKGLSERENWFCHSKLLEHD